MNENQNEPEQSLSESSTDEKTDDNEGGGKKWLIWSLLAILVFLIFLAIAVYFFNWRNRYSAHLLKVIPYPAVMIGGSELISFSEVDKNIASIRRFYENQDFSQVGLRVDFNSEDGVKRLKIKEKDLLNKMIEDRLIESMAQEKGIHINQSELDRLFEEQLNQGVDEVQISKDLLLLYGWSLQDFKDKMIKPDLYRERLNGYIKNNDPAVKEQKALSQKALEELKSGGNFSEEAKKYSYGESASEGGDLGWFKKEDLMQPIAESVSEMEKGETSEMIETDLGFHIVKLDDTKIEDGVPLYKLSQIFLPTLTVGDWLAKNARDINVRMLVRGYRWNDQLRTVEFTDKNLEDFENNLENNSSGDASLLFNS